MQTDQLPTIQTLYCESDFTTATERIVELLVDEGPQAAREMTEMANGYRPRLPREVTALALAVYASLENVLATDYSNEIWNHLTCRPNW